MVEMLTVGNKSRCSQVYCGRIPNKISFNGNPATLDLDTQRRTFTGRCVLTWFDIMVVFVFLLLFTMTIVRCTREHQPNNDKSQGLR